MTHPSFAALQCLLMVGPKPVTGGGIVDFVLVVGYYLYILNIRYTFLTRIEVSGMFVKSII